VTHRRFALGVAVLAVVLAMPAIGYQSTVWFEGADGHAHAMRQRKTMHAPMLVYFRVDWCPHCRRFDELLDDSQVRSALAGVIKVRIDPEKGDAEKALFQDQYGGTGYPTIFLHPADGGSPRRLSHTGPAERFIAQFGDSRS
jgi:thiol:disulfide interchange protein